MTESPASSREQSPREANSFPAIQEIPPTPAILRNQNVHYHVYMILPVVCVLSQMNQIHNHISLVSIVMLPSHLRVDLSSGLSSSGFPPELCLLTQEADSFTASQVLRILCNPEVYFHVQDPASRCDSEPD